MPCQQYRNLPLTMIIWANLLSLLSGYPEDRTLFEIDQRGVITSKTNFDYEIDKRYYEFSVIYTATDGTSYQTLLN